MSQGQGAGGGPLGGPWAMAPSTHAPCPKEVHVELEAVECIDVGAYT